MSARYEKLTDAMLCLVHPLPVLWLYRDLFSVVFGDDAIIHRYPFAVHISRVLSSGGIPIWNPFSWAGTPFLGDLSADIWYPLNALYVIMPTEYAFRMFHILHVIMGGWCAYMLARVCQISPIGSVTSGLIFCLGPMYFQTIYSGYLMYTIGLPYLPAVMALHILAIRRNSLALDSVCGLVLGIQILGSSIQVSAMCMIALTVLSGYHIYLNRTAERVAGRVVSIAITCSIAGLVGALKLLPIVVFMEEGLLAHGLNLRDLSLTDELKNIFQGASASLSPFAALRLVFPDGEGGLTWALYLGAGTLLLTIIGNVSQNDEGNIRGGFVILSLASVVIALGIFGPIQWVVHWLPGGELLRRPERYLFLLGTGIAVIAGSGADNLMRAPGKCRTRLVRLLKNKMLRRSAAGFIAIVVLIEFSTRRFSSLAYKTLENIWKNSSFSGELISVAPLATNPSDVYEGVKYALETHLKNFSYIPALEEVGYSLLVLGFMGLVVVGAGRILSPTWTGWAVNTCIILNYWLLHVSYDVEIDYRNNPSSYFQRNSEVYEVIADDPGTFRVLALGPDIPYHTEKGVVRRNQGMVMGFESLDGVDNYVNTGFLEFMKRANSIPSNYQPSKPFEIRWDRPDSRLLVLLNVKYVVSPGEINEAGINFVCRDENGLGLYQRERYNPRAYVVSTVEYVANRVEALNRICGLDFDLRHSAVVEGLRKVGWSGANRNDDTNSSAQIKLRSNNGLTVVVKCERESFLVLSEVFTSGWEATIDGQRTEIYRANGFLRAVRIPAGKHHVVFKFSPRSLHVGAVCNLLAFCITGTLLWIRRKQQAKSCGINPSSL